MSLPDTRWMEYDDALAEARRQGKPILLALTASWCSPEESSPLVGPGGRELRDRQAVDEIAGEFLLARVDVERRPDLLRRYGAVEPPASLLLGPSGEPLLGIGVAPRRGQPAPPASADLRLLWRMVESALLLSLDEVHGGFGAAPKRPEAYAVAYAVEQYRRSGCRRWHEAFALGLDGVTRGLFDARAGGFYQSAATRDWQEPTTAKLLGVNAELIRAYLLAYEATRRTSYLDVATRSLQFVLGNLRSGTLRSGVPRGPAFAGSLAPAGGLDPTIYLPANEEMVGSLLLAARVTGESGYAATAHEVQRYLLEHLFDPERGFAHFASAADVARLADVAPGLFGLLLDNAAALVGLARAYTALAEGDYLAAAVRAADLLLASLGGLANGGPASGAPGPAFEDGVLAAEGLLALAVLTGVARYRCGAGRLAGWLAAELAGQRPGALARFGALLQGLLDGGEPVGETGRLAPGQPVGHQR